MAVDTLGKTLGSADVDRMARHAFSVESQDQRGLFSTWSPCQANGCIGGSGIDSQFEPNGLDQFGEERRVLNNKQTNLQVVRNLRPRP